MAIRWPPRGFLRPDSRRFRLMAAPDLLISGLNAVVTSDYGHRGAKLKIHTRNAKHHIILSANVVDFFKKVPKYFNFPYTKIEVN